MHGAWCLPAACPGRSYLLTHALGMYSVIHIGQGKRREDTDMALTREEGIAKMTALLNRQSLPKLGEALELLGRKPELDSAERLARAVIIDVICERCPAADAAFDAWADSDDMDQRNATAAIVAAAKGPGK